ncbi:MAG: GNAT family N-acetyltransferase [Bacillota bacterium]|nr:GNAT family N-acetyltransferase [Bacillota bacterium]
MKMFRQGDATDIAGILAFAGKEPELNLFLIGDLEFYGLDNDFIDVWIEETSEGKLKTVLLRYHRNFLLHSETNDYDRASVWKIVQAHDGTFLNCSGACFSYLKEELPANAEIRPMKMAKMRQLIAPEFRLMPVRIAAPDDAERIVRSMFQIEEFRSMLTDSLEARIRLSKAKMTDGFSTHFIIEADGVVIANANTIAVSRKAAMIGGVFTLPAYRGKGLATSVVAMLCQNLLERDIAPVLFFENPKAATIYHKLGFVDFAEWIIVCLQN